MLVQALDHLVLTVADLDASAIFYGRVLGMQRVTFGEGRTALLFGDQKINLHPAAMPLLPHALRPSPGSADLCFVTQVTLADWLTHLAECRVALEAGPEARTGALGQMMSLYFRDPDGNLIEIAKYPEP